MNDIIILKKLMILSLTLVSKPIYEIEYQYNYYLKFVE